MTSQATSQVQSQSPGASGLADRYAVALFELADADGKLDTVAGDLSALETMITESKDLSRMLASPVISRDAQARALDALLDKVNAQPLVRNFVGLVAKNRRLMALRDMIDAYRARLSGARGEVTAHVSSSTSLSDQQVDAIRQSLKKTIGTDVAVSTDVDPALLGGLVVRVGSRMVDSSLKTKLQQLSLSMKGVG